MGFKLCAAVFSKHSSLGLFNMEKWYLRVPRKKTVQLVMSFRDTDLFLWVNSEKELGGPQKNSRPTDSEFDHQGLIGLGFPS